MSACAAAVRNFCSFGLQGGYLSARYALANPDHVEHLILVCPAGVVSVPGVAGEEDVHCCTTSVLPGCQRLPA